MTLAAPTRHRSPTQHGWHRCASLRAGGRACWRRVARRGDRCDRCWTELAASTAVTDRAELAAEADLPGWVAQLLAVDVEAMVRVLVAERPGVDDAVLRRLAFDRDASVRAAAASNPGLAEATERRLACQEQDLSVLAALAAKPSTAPVVRGWLARHPSPAVAGRARSPRQPIS